jgi:hypothetical protein
MFPKLKILGVLMKTRCRILRAIVSILALSSLAFATGRFYDPVNYSAGTSPGAIAAGDFNGDGRLDIVTLSCCGGANIFHVLLGNGDGSFQAATEFSANLSGYQVSVGDMNRDKALDLIVTTNSGIAIFLGDGDGTFQPAALYSAGSTNQEVVADFNGDLNLDVAATTSAGSVSMLLGNGDGTLQSPLSYSAPGAYGIAAGDFNNDRKRDLVTSGPFPPYSVNVLLGNGDGSFQPAVRFRTKIPVINVSVADFNQDGARDIVAIGTYFDRSIAVLPGRGNGTFAAPLVSAERFEVSQISPGDFDKDGFTDLMVIDSAHVSAQALKGKGDGRFGFDGSYHLNGGYPERLVAADFDRDGFLDIAISVSQEAGYVAVLINTGSTGR